HAGDLGWTRRRRRRGRGAGRDRTALRGLRARVRLHRHRGGPPRAAGARARAAVGAPVRGARRRIGADGGAGRGARGAGIRDPGSDRARERARRARPRRSAVIDPALGALVAGYVSEVLAAAVRLGIPILLAALGEVVLERAGLVNVGIEGMML